MADSTGYTVPVFCMSSGQVLTTAYSHTHVWDVSLCCGTGGSYLEVRALYIAFKNIIQVYFFLENKEANIEPDRACSILLGLFDEQER